MQELWVKAKEYWANLALREKRMVSAGAVLLSIFIVYAGVWSPIVDHNMQMRSRISANANLLVWMKSADNEIKKLEKQNKNQTKSNSPVVILEQVQKQIDGAKLTSQLTQLKQISNEAIQLQFQKVDFDKLIGLLTTMVKKQSVVITQLSVVPDNESGIVNADIVLSIE